MNRKNLTFPLIYALLAILTSCGEKNFENSGAVWATTYHITYSSTHDLGDSIIAVMRQVENELSMFADSSTVSRLNRGEDPDVGPMFRDVFTLSKKINALSSGAFDPTVGPLTDLWGFGRRKLPDKAVPTQAEIDSALRHVGIVDCRLVGNKIEKKHPSTVFDFSSVAKGYGVDAVAAMLARNGVTDYMVEIGGEISARGVNPRGMTWRIQIDAPVEGDAVHSRMYVLELDNAAVATSGNYRNFRNTYSGRVGHTIDPHSGIPVATTTAAATVIAPDCATADALATACMVLEADKALEMIEKLDRTEALLAVSSGDSLILRMTSGFPESF